MIYSGRMVQTHKGKVTKKTCTLYEVSTAVRGGMEGDVSMTGRREENGGRASSNSNSSSEYQPS